MNVERSVDLQKSVLSFYHGGPVEQTQAIRSGWRQVPLPAKPLQPIRIVLWIFLKIYFFTCISV